MGSTPADPQPKSEPMGPGHLPIEILLEIASELALEDFLACAQVSRQWNMAWTQPRLAAALCRSFFPTLDWVQHLRRVPEGVPQPDPELHPNGRCPDRKTDEPEMMAYGEGNIVWSDYSRLIFIDNLYTWKRKVLNGDDWDFVTGRDNPHLCAVGKSLLVTEVGHLQRRPYVGPEVFFYHLGKNVGVRHVFKIRIEREPCMWLSIRTWGERAFVSTGPSSIHVFSHDGASLSIAHVIDPYGSMPPELHRFAHPDDSPCRDQYRPNYLPNPYDPDGVFIVVAGPILKSQPDITHVIVHEFSGTTHITTYTCDIEETMRSVMESVLGKDSEFIELELKDVRSRVRKIDGDWGESYMWPGVYGSDEGVHEVFRFVFRAHETALPGDGPLLDWVLHHQVSVTFSTIKRQWGVQRTFIDDGGDRVGDEINEWKPRASMLRNQQLLRIYYDSHEHLDARPIITTRDVDAGAGERTRRGLGKRDDLYPMNNENKAWSHRCDPNLHLDVRHDEDFTVVWDMLHGDCVVFDFREPE